MSEAPTAASPEVEGGGAGRATVAVVHAGEYVNKTGGERIERECRNNLASGCQALVINFRETELVNSIGVSILLGVIDVAERTGAQIVFAGAKRHTVELFELLGLTRHVRLADDERAALTTLSESPNTTQTAGHC